LPDTAITTPSAPTSAAPTGTSPCQPAVSAAAKARDIGAPSSPVGRFVPVGRLVIAATAAPRYLLASMNDTAPQRIAKVLARAGLCSRRDAERWIAEGRVAVDGKVLTSPAVTVTEASDVRVDGVPLPEPERARLWRYHKPAGLVTTHRDEKGRATVFAALPKELPRLISIGRLDLNSEGLLLLTNDGALARRLELPATGWLRRYKVRVHGVVEPARLAALEKGVTIDGIAYGPVRAQLERQQGSNAWVALSLREGKNREVRRVLEHLGYPVTRLIRLSYGPFQLGHLERGAVEEVPKSVLADQLGSGEGPVKPHARRRR
jgi:23S rRNA pseudouridine2605 synthase